ncbi:YigZ family protein [Pseudolactococcus paracarnosus]|uniref:YigZ family protein n=1 Tax=Pseudolactococcus paracarnosus TaxID=2749962 RepID=A0A7L4WIE5_9LACT|nr:YigZ family protein [Lactococcus paracarnosus]MCJ1976701.1 YigZ family protein [Lactococcus paracarnosus]MCJ1982913.1 YigZ family protein [Lactococcus paracarnosus]MCJ1993349.1 YigZ family protein [Lactococcus paracarnosus]MCJ1998649.1 YigZ family protein [Lactococcus paracarnosus]QDJ29145.1 YigZ family protein [Lactococcus paracarnosus]
MNTTIKSDFIFEEEIKKSRFICQLKRVYSEAEARDFITSVKKQHHKANHNVSAFTIGDQQEIQRTSDDGEPSGTAGMPMLDILKKREIINVVAVVTRYFGGIKLGAGGLIRAYAGSVNHAIDAVGLVKIVEQTQLRLEMDYSLFDNVSRYLSSEGLTISDSVFTDKVKLTSFCDTDRMPSLVAGLTDQFHGQLTLIKGDKKLVEVDI